MSIQSRARKIQKQVSALTYQQILTDLQEMRFYPRHDELYVRCRNSRAYRVNVCMDCGGTYPVGKSRDDELLAGCDSLYCQACFDDYGKTSCLRCSRPVPGSENTERFCEECDIYIGEHYA